MVRCLSSFFSRYLERIFVVLCERFAVEFVHHLHYADDLLLAVEYRNAQQTVDYEPVLLRQLHAGDNRKIQREKKKFIVIHRKYNLVKPV